MQVCDKFGKKFYWNESSVNILKEKNKILLNVDLTCKEDFMNYLFVTNFGKFDFYAYAVLKSDSRIFKQATTADWNDIYNYCLDNNCAYLYIKFHDEDTYHLRIELDSKNEMLNHLNEIFKSFLLNYNKEGEWKEMAILSNRSDSFNRTYPTGTTTTNTIINIPNWNTMQNNDKNDDEKTVTEEKNMLEELFVKKEVMIGLDLQSGAPVLDGNKYFKDETVYTTIEEFVYKTKGFLLSTAIANIHEGDIVWFDNSYVLITDIGEEAMTGLKLTGETIVFSPTKHSVLGNTMSMLPKLYTLFDGMGLNMNSANGFNPMMLLMLKDRKSDNGDDLLEMMLLSQMMKGK